MINYKDAITARGMVVTVFILFLLGILLVASYNWGYSRGEQSVYGELYDQSLMSISSNIIFKDSIDNNSAHNESPLILARIESDIAKIAQLYKKYHFNFAEIGRCAVTRRVRNFAKQKIIFSDRKHLAENEYPIDEVMEYLNNECPGEPSHKNWAK